MAEIAEGIIVQVPNEKPQFVPIASGTLPCAPCEVASRVRHAVRTTLFGEPEEDMAQEQGEFCVLYCQKNLEEESCAERFVKAMSTGVPCMVRVLFGLLGGKGGFGSLLRGQKGRGKKTTNLDSMRDLSGRRLRHSKAVERIKEWMEKQKREDDLVNALTSEGPELPKPVPQAESLDPEFIQRLKRAAAERPGLVSQGLRKIAADVKMAKEAKQASEGGAAASTGAAASKRPRSEPSAGSSPAGLHSAASAASAAAGGAQEPLSSAWLDALDSLGGLSSPEEGTEGMEAMEGEAEVEGSEPKLEPGGAAASASASASSASTVSESRQAQQQQQQQQQQASSVHLANGASASACTAEFASGDADGPEVTAAPAVTATTPSASDLGSGGETRADPAAPAPDPLQLTAIRAFGSAAELAEKVSAAVLKVTLQQLGLKCGGKLEERAARLFLLKDKALEELPKSALATSARAR